MLSAIALFFSLIAGSHGDEPSVPSAIAFSEIGAKGTANYKGDAMGITPIADGARLHTDFQKLEAEITREGLWLTSTEESGGKIRVVAEAIGRGDLLDPTSVIALPSLGLVARQEKSVSFLRPGLIEEYSVSMDGVRQDFVITQRPVGRGHLRVDLGLTGARAAEAGYGAKIIFTSSGRELGYSRLKVTDATGRILAARMEVTKSDKISVQVNDEAAAYPIRIDPTFSDADWVSIAPSTALPGVNGWVFSIAVHGTTVYVGGSFTVAGNVSARNIAKWDGSAWSPLGTDEQNGTSGSVNAIAILSPTEVYVGGGFSSVADSTSADISTGNIAKWDGSSNTWAALGTLTQNGTDGVVRAIAAHSATEIYVGGSFLAVADSSGAGISANRIAKWDGGAWSVLGTPTQNGTGGTVRTIASRSTTEVFVGGDFTTVADSANSSLSANCICKWDGNTNGWSPLGTPTQNGTNSRVNAIAVSSATEIFVGGSFTSVADFSIANLSANYIAKWNSGSSVWSVLGSPTQNGTSLFVNAIAVVTETEVYVGGVFSSTRDDIAGWLSVSSVARWNGNYWTPLGGDPPRNGTNSTVFAIAAVSTSNVYVGGAFSAVGDTSNVTLPAGCIARWNGNSWGQMPAGSGGLNGEVRAIATEGANLYIGGSFTRIGSMSANRVAKWNGSVWAPLGTATRNGVAGNGFVHVNAIAALSSTEVYVGGGFTAVADFTSSSISARCIAKWNGSTNRWNLLGTATQNGAGSTVQAISALSTTEIFVGGFFTTVSDSSGSNFSANRIAKWNAMTNSWSRLGTASQNGAGNIVFAIDAFSPTEVYVGGSFTTVADSSGASISVNRIARWNGSANSWSPLGTTTQNGTSSDVRAIAALSPTDVYVGGFFLTVADSTNASLSANSIAKWNGTTWSVLGTATQNGTDRLVNTILALSEAEVYVGGNFTAVRDSSIANLPANRVAKWNGGAQVWSAVGGGVNDSVNALAADSAGHLFLGGKFLSAGSSPSAVSLCVVQANIAADIVIEQPVGSLIADGGTKNIGATVLGTPVSLNFIVKNPSALDLTLSTITLDGADAGDFSVMESPVSPVPGGGSATFTVQFAPTTGAPGTRTATIHIPSDGPASKNPYDIILTGAVLSNAVDTDSDGLNDAAEFRLAALGFDWQVGQSAEVSAFLTGNALFTQPQYSANRTFGQNDVILAPNTYGLYNLSQVQTLNIGTPLIQRDGFGQFKLTIEVEKSTTLQPTSFLPFPMTAPQTTIHDGKLEFEFTVPDTAAFFRLQSH